MSDRKYQSQRLILTMNLIVDPWIYEYIFKTDDI